MIITKIEPQKNPDRVNIYIDGNFAFGLSKEIQIKYSLHEDMEIDGVFIENVLLEDEKLKAIDVSLNYLSYRNRSTKEIVDKLKKKGFEDHIIENTLDYLKHYNLIDDYQFSKSFMKDKIKLNKYGPERIKFELYRRGIPKEIVEEVIREYENGYEYSLAYDLATKKIKSYKTDDKKVLYSKLGSFLQRRGFSYDCISKVLRDILQK